MLIDAAKRGEKDRVSSSLFFFSVFVTFVLSAAISTCRINCGSPRVDSIMIVAYFLLISFVSSTGQARTCCRPTSAAAPVCIMPPDSVTGISLNTFCKMVRHTCRDYMSTCTIISHRCMSKVYAFRFLIALSFVCSASALYFVTPFSM